MHGSDNKRQSSSTPTKRPQTLKDENDKSYQELGPILQSPKKQVKKHYMSPTIAAASKAILPKKKILGENNQPLDNTHLQKTLNIRASQESLTHKTPSHKTPSHGTELDENEQNHVFVADPAASKPYDPVTNYLSPRPKFLRYQPNRCREILRRKENEKNDGSDVSSVSTSCSFESQKEDSEDQQAPVGFSIDCSREEDDFIRSSIDDSFGEAIALVGAKEASIDEKNSMIGAMEASISEKNSMIDGAKEVSIGENDSLDGLNSIIEDALIVSQEGSVGSSEDCSIKLEEAFAHGLTVEQDVSVGAQKASSGSSEDDLIKRENALVGAKEASIGENDSLDGLNSIIEDALIVSQEGSVGSSEDCSIKLEEAFAHGLTVEQDVSVGAQKASSGSSEDDLIKRENALVGAQEASVDSSFDFSMKQENALIGTQEALIDSSFDGLMKQENDLIAPQDASIHGSTVEEIFSARAQAASEASIRSSEDCVIKQENALIGTQEALIYSSFDGSMKQEDDLVAAQEAQIDSSADDLKRQESVETEDESEEIEEVRKWGLTKLLKFSLVSIALVVSTLYISTINSPSPSFSSQAIKSLGSQYSLHEFVKSFEDVKQLNGTEQTFDEGIWEEDVNADDLTMTGNLNLLSGELAELQSLESEELNEVLESQTAKIDRLFDDDVIAKSNEILAQIAIIEEFESSHVSQIPIVSSDGIVSLENEGSIKLTADGNPENEIIMEPIEIMESQTAETDQAGDENDDSIKLTADGNPENEIIMEPIEVMESQTGDDEIEKSKEILDQMAVEEFESFHESQIPIVSDILVATEVISSTETDQSADGNLESEIIMERVEVIDKQVEEFESFHESQIPIVSDILVATEVISSTETDQSADGNLESEIIMERVEVIDKQVDNEMDGTENTANDNSNPSMVNPESLPSLKDELIKYVGSKLYLLVIPIFVMALFFGFRSMNKKQGEEKSKPILSHDDDTEKYKKAYSFVNSTTSMVNSLKEEDPSESYESRTEEASSFRSRSLKNRMAESEISSQSVSVEKGRRYKAQSGSSYSQPALSESSYGSFTTETRIFKKKKDNGDGDGYSAEITTTPVRRSSRLLKREI